MDGWHTSLHRGRAQDSRVFGAPASPSPGAVRRELPIRRTMIRPSARPAPAPRRRHCLLALAGGLASCLAGTPAWALDPPKGKVLLSISGAVTVTNAPGRADFDLAMLDAMPQHGFRAATPWFKEARQFSGPLLRDVLAAAGAQGQALRAVALNNFKSDIPVEDAQKHKVLVATRLDNKPMSLREKGPLFIIYPFDDNAELRQERYYSRSVWQLRALEVK